MLVREERAQTLGGNDPKYLSKRMSREFAKDKPDGARRKKEA